MKNNAFVPYWSVVEPNILETVGNYIMLEK